MADITADQVAEAEAAHVAAKDSGDATESADALAELRQAFRRQEEAAGRRSLVAVTNGEDGA